MTQTVLTLSDKEHGLLQEILEERQRRLLVQIAHADHHDFKVLLKEREELVESLLGRLAVAA
jgi:trehalose utilization protein